jgi:hypothetical protein
MSRRHELVDPGIWLPSPSLYVACASHRQDADETVDKDAKKKKLPFGFVAPAQETVE